MMLLTTKMPKEQKNCSVIDIYEQKKATTAAKGVQGVYYIIDIYKKTQTGSHLLLPTTVNTCQLDIRWLRERRADKALDTETPGICPCSYTVT